MAKHSKILIIALISCGLYIIALGDRGTFLKKNKSHFNIAIKGSLKNSILFNLKSGVTYRGSFLLNQHLIGNNLINDAYISYKKGNTIYVLPYKQKIAIPEYSAKDGYKLIIRPN